MIAGSIGNAQVIFSSSFEADETPRVVANEVFGSIIYLAADDSLLPATEYLDGTTVEILVLNDDESLSRRYSPAPQTTLGSTQALLTQTIELPATGSVVVNVTRLGFSGYSRRYDFLDGESFALNLAADLKIAASGSVPMSEAISVSGQTLNGYNFTLVNNPDGTQSIASGLMTDSTGGQLAISVPPLLAPAGTTELSARLRSFDPNQDRDATSFPGAYADNTGSCLLYTSPSPRDLSTSRMPSSA